MTWMRAWRGQIIILPTGATKQREGAKGWNPVVQHSGESDFYGPCQTAAQVLLLFACFRACICARWPSCVSPKMRKGSLEEGAHLQRPRALLHLRRRHPPAQQDVSEERIRICGFKRSENRAKLNKLNFNRDSCSRSSSRQEKSGEQMGEVCGSWHQKDLGGGRAFLTRPQATHEPSV